MLCVIFINRLKMFKNPREQSSEKKNIMVFDDLLLEKQKHLWIVLFQRKTQQRWLFLFSSKLFQAVASNNQRECEFHCLFPQNLKNFNHIFDDHVTSDMTKEEFRQLCKTAWEKQHGFVIIDLSSKKHNGKYRSDLDEFYIPN